jgi:hypothetical protein
MNPMFIMVVCFGLLVVGVIVATAIFNVKVGSGAPLTPWMGRVRQFQDQQENAGWRIRMIPYDDVSRPMTISFGGLVGLVPVAGALGFLVGLALATYDNQQYLKLGLIVAVSGWLVGLLGVWLKARVVRLDWDVAPARCVDRELRKAWVVGSKGSGSWGWFWRIVCQYEYLGIPYRVTPAVYWGSFTSEEAAQKFLEERVLPKGECMLRLDPKNPLRTELMDQGVKDKLLY